MADETMDLWPDNFEPTPESDRPVRILRHQAMLLGQKTGGRVEAEVKTTPAPPDTPISFSPVRLADEPEPEPAQLAHRFLLRVPALEDYRYALFTLYQQPVRPYPSRIDFDERMWEVKSEQDLVAALQYIFAHESTRKIIGALITQSQGVAAGER